MPSEHVFNIHVEVFSKRFFIQSDRISALEIPKHEVTNAKDDPYPLFLIQIQFKYGNPLSITRTQVIINQ